MVTFPRAMLPPTCAHWSASRRCTQDAFSAHWDPVTDAMESSRSTDPPAAREAQLLAELKKPSPLLFVHRNARGA